MNARHGTRRMYDLGCRCHDCRYAAGAYHADYQERTKTSGPQYLPIEPVRRRVEQLVKLGISLRQVGRISGVEQSTLFNIMGRSNQTRVQRKTWDRIMRADYGQLDAWTYVPAGPTLEAIDRMWAIGFSKAWMSEQIGAELPSKTRNRFVRAWMARRAHELDEFVGDGGVGKCRDGSAIGARGGVNRPKRSRKRAA